MGNDYNGRWLRQTFGMEGRPWEIIEAPTTISVGIVHTDKERTFMTTTGHLKEFSTSHILAGLEEVPEGGGIALLSGVFLSPPLIPEYDRLMEKLAAHGYDMAIDPGWPTEDGMMRCGPGLWGGSNVANIFLSMTKKPRP